MFIQNNSAFFLYFGGIQTALSLSDIAEHKGFPARSYPIIDAMCAEHGLDRIAFLHQTHSPHGYVINSNFDDAMFVRPGDFLIGKISRVGLAVLTADCLPVAAYDAKSGTVGIAHAGWRGAAAGVLDRFIDQFCATSAARIDQIALFLGPSARKCCYEVGPEFLDYFKDGVVFIEKLGKLYFDLPEWCVRFLHKKGVSLSNIARQNNVCTICSAEFCSVRRGNNGNVVGRQMSIVAVRER